MPSVYNTYSLKCTASNPCKCKKQRMRSELECIQRRLVLSLSLNPQAPPPPTHLRKDAHAHPRRQPHARTDAHAQPLLKAPSEVGYVRPVVAPSRAQPHPPPCRLGDAPTKWFFREGVVALPVVVFILVIVVVRVRVGWAFPRAVDRVDVPRTCRQAERVEREERVEVGLLNRFGSGRIALLSRCWRWKLAGGREIRMLMEGRQEGPAGRE